MFAKLQLDSLSLGSVGRPDDVVLLDMPCAVGDEEAGGGASAVVFDSFEVGAASAAAAGVSDEAGGPGAAAPGCGADGAA